jgi:hypothetical protein
LVDPAHQKDLIKTKNNLGENSIHVAIKSNNIKVIERILNWVKNVLQNTQKELKALLMEMDKNGTTTIHCAVEIKNLKVLSVLIDFLKENLSDSDLRKIYKASLRNTNENLLHAIARTDKKICTLIVAEMKRFLESTDRNLLIKSINNFDKYNPLHMSIVYKNLEVFEIIFYIFNQNLTDTEQKELIMSSTLNYENIFSVAAEYENKEIINILLDKTEQLLNNDEWKILLVSERQYLKQAAQLKSRELIDRIEAIVRRKFDGEDRETMMNMLQIS